MDFLAEEEKSRSILTKGISILVLLVMVAFVPISLLRGDLVSVALRVLLSGLAAVGFFLVQFKKKTDLAANYIVAVSIGSICIFIYKEGGVFAPAVVWLAAIPILSTFLLGIRKAVYWTGFCVVVTLIICSFEAYNSFPNKLDDTQLSITLFASLLLAPACTMALANLFHRHKVQMNKVLNENNEKLRILTESLSDVVQEKQALIGVVCHDIATPLMTILTNVAILEELMKKLPEKSINTLEGRFQPKIKKGVSKIEQSALSINEAISLTREMMAMEAGKLEVHLVKINLLNIVSKVRELFSERLERKNVKIQVHADKKDFYIVAEERALIHSVIGNVVSNAIKFSPESGSISIKISKSKDAKIEVRIKDEGEGIPVQVLRNLFSWKSVTTRKGTMGEKGTGFGMPAVKAWMKCFNGRLIVKSFYGKVEREGFPEKEITEKDNVVIEYYQGSSTQAGAEITLVFPDAA